VSVTPPVPIEVEVFDGRESDPKLVAEVTEAIHTKLVFRSEVTLVPETEFGEAGYKTRLTVSRP
jgi:phenylpyruvate tautomerase PptA (4-oxalocrotonate tautomerase family)